MTPEQAYKLRKGDHILVEMVVKEDQHDYLVAVYMPHLLGVKSLAVAPGDIHSILLRPLEAGDRVRAADMQSLLVGTILAIHVGQAWVRWPAGDTTVEFLSDLQRVEDQ